MQISCDSPFSSPGHGGGAPSPFPGAAAPLARRRPRTPAGLPLGWGGPGQDSGVTEPGKGVPDLGEGGGTGMPGMGGESRASRLGRGGGGGGLLPPAPTVPRHPAQLLAEWVAPDCGIHPPIPIPIPSPPGEPPPSSLPGGGGGTAAVPARRRREAVGGRRPGGSVG